MNILQPRIYQNFRPTNRTILLRMPFGLVDLQSLPPRSWCISCGAEVYRKNQTHCNKCLSKQLIIDS